MLLGVKVALTVPGYHHRQRKGQYHVAAITEQGALYTWGFGMFGQLLHFETGLSQRDGDAPSGLDEDECRAIPEIVRCIPHDEKVMDVSCGVTFSIVLTKTPQGRSKVCTSHSIQPQLADQYS